MRIVIETSQASTSLLQRRLRIGYNRAARIIEQLEERGIISGRDGSKPRQILVDKDNME
ncbi:DNA translocase FtsK [bioreactor metagenome]|uniref:DNA translocase FtsK n=2 Tax=root TaxID=1 RepID=A0A645C1B8_9ZZZZ